MTHQNNWWNEFFDDYRPVFGKSKQRENNKEARYLVRKLKLKKGMKFLDCPCGFGRLSLPLARMGIKVTGVDITQSYLDEFAEKARELGVKVELIKRDMRRISFRNQFHAAANLSTSFGYFESESQNLLVLKRVFEALRPGGRFLLSLFNRDWIIVGFVPNNWYEVSGIRVLQRRRFDYSRSIMHDEWYFMKGGEEKFHETTLRIYAFHELRAMFERVGFVDIEGFGSLDDQPTGRTNRDMYVIARKPKSRE
jgi:2-polyprenyl-3-methyl-5-hydroxy-6-metoxy-1,4-benzoquinol methylase